MRESLELGRIDSQTHRILLGRPSANQYLIRGDKQERMLRILLSKAQPRRTWYSVAKDAESSYGSAHRYLSSLSKRGFIDEAGLRDPKGLFKLWATGKDRRLFREYHVQNPEAVLSNTTMDYVMTGYFAESIVGGHLFPRFREFYVIAKDAKEWDSLLLANGVVGRGNVKVILADSHVFYERQEIQGWPVVSIQQLIVDLMRTGTECAEAADLLIRREYDDRTAVR
jgi:hypothetical protein